MTVLTARKPFTSNEPVLLVENQLALGAHLIRLIVVDDEGLESDPFDATITVVEGRSTNPLGGITLPPGRVVEAVQPVPVAPVKPKPAATIKVNTVKAATTKPATTKPAAPKPKPTKDGDKP